MVNWITAVPVRRSDGVMVVVDGGATRSRVAVADADGGLVSFARGGPTNGRSVGPDVAAANLVAAIEAALAAGAVDAGAVGYCLVTSASIDTVDQSEHLSDALRPMLRSATVVTLPDTIGCWAATASLGPAVAVISGTGSVVVVADRDRGRWQRYGGWDFILGDEGSGYAFGRAALQEALLVGEGRSGAVALHDAVLHSDAAVERGVTAAEGLPDAAHHPPIDKAWIASFAEVLLHLADEGDARCRAILRRELAVLADAAASGVELLAAQLGFGAPSAAVGLFGGTFRSPVVVEEFVSAIAARTTLPFRAFVPRHSALVGAFALAVGAAGDRPIATVEAAADRLAEALAGRG